MKVAICGKGGCGKSTTTTLLAKELVKSGKRVLIIDSDESNFGLHRQLGMELPQDFTVFFGGKETVLGEMMQSNFTHRFFDKAWHIQDIPQEFFEEKGGVKLMASGKIHEADEGCACAMGSVIGQFINNLETAEDEAVLVDMEAGVEHFGRGIDNGVDLILMIVDPSYESLCLTQKIADLSKSIQKPVFYVLNKVDESNKSIMLDAIADNSKIAGIIPVDNGVASAGLRGKELQESIPAVTQLAQFLSRNCQ